MCGEAEVGCLAESNRVASTSIVTVKDVFDLVREDLAKVEEEFARQTVSSVQPITEIGQYLYNGGGKRLRPALVLLTSKLCGYEGPAAIRLGAVVEMIHTATLVHDDIIDEAETRRDDHPRIPDGVITAACSRATGFTCRRSTSPSASATSESLIC